MYEHSFDRDTLLRRIAELPFPKEEYWILSGGAMVLYGFRPRTHDVDLGCTSRLADQLERQGYPVSQRPDEPRKIVYADDVELFENWLDGTVERVSGVPVVSVDGLIRMKQRLGREKDWRDIALIKKARENGACVLECGSRAHLHFSP